MRARLAGIVAVILLGASTVTATMAAFQLFGYANPAAEPLVQFGVWAGVIVLMILLVPQSNFANTGDFDGKPTRAQLRARLTGPFTEIGRPGARSIGRLPVRIWLALILMTVLLFLAHAFLPIGFLIASVMMTRSSAYEGDPIGIEAERVLGTEPRLRRNRRRSG